MSPLSLRGRTAFITGGASGIGFAIAEKLVQQGGKVAIGDVDEASARKAAASLGSSSIAVKVNVADEDSVRTAIERVEESLGGLDLAVNSAGVQLAVGAITDLDARNIQMTIAVNLTGVIFCMKHEIAAMRRTNGRACAIINIASATASQPLAYDGPYSATKAGVVALTKSVAAEVGQYNIRVNSISPGYTDTPMMREANIDPNFAIARTPLQRCGEASDVADLAVFILSENAKQVHGVDIPIDGGLLVGRVVKPPGF